MIAGPYRSGTISDAERAGNLRLLNQAACEIFRRGHIPIVGVNAALPLIDVAGEEQYDSIMMPMSLRLADRCDGALRIGGDSAGADREVELIRNRGGRIFRDISEIPDMADHAD
ncbi:MAG: DUF4406 domain-containing protein [Bacteroidota bacterium]